MLNAALISETAMITKVEASSQNRVDKALESLRAARVLQRDRQSWGVERVNLYVEDVDSDWLEKWGEDEEQLAGEIN